MSSQVITKQAACTIVNDNFRKLLGRLLTIVEAISPNAQQCKSTKDLVRREISEIQSSAVWQLQDQQLQDYLEGHVNVRESATHSHD